MTIKIMVAVMLEHGQLFVGCFVEPTTITRTRTNSPPFPVNTWDIWSQYWSVRSSFNYRAQDGELACLVDCDNASLFSPSIVPLFC